MKVHSVVPFKFRKAELPKGESDFDLSKLNSSERAHFQKLVDAKIVTILDAPPAPTPAPAKSEAKTPEPAPTPAPAPVSTATPAPEAAADTAVDSTKKPKKG